MKTLLNYLFKKTISLWELFTLLVVMLVASESYTITPVENKENITLYFSILGVYFISSFIKGFCGALMKDLKGK